MSNFDSYQEEAWAEQTNLRRYDHPVVEAFATQRVKHIEDMLHGWQPKNALDVGCGDGFGMHWMAPLVDQIHGCDRSPAMLERNPATADRLTQCDAYAPPFEKNQFDLVYCWELLHHIDRPQEVVNGMADIASNCVMLCEPNVLNPAMAAFGILSPVERGLLRFSPFYLKSLLKKAGLKRIQCHSVGWFTPNRTPESLMKGFCHLPYHVPLAGMYCIALGYTS